MFSVIFQQVREGLLVMQDRNLSQILASQDTGLGQFVVCPFMPRSRIPHASVSSSVSRLVVGVPGGWCTCTIATKALCRYEESLYSWKYEQQYSGHGKTQAKAFPERATHTALVCASCCTLAGSDGERGFLPCPQPSVSTASL